MRFRPIPRSASARITKDVVEGKSAPELVYRDNTVPRKSFTGRSKKDRTGEIA